MQGYRQGVTIGVRQRERGSYDSSELGVLATDEPLARVPVVLLAVDFAVLDLAVLDLAAGFLAAVDLVLVVRRLVDGAAARRSASNSIARWSVIASGASPLRSDAFVSPSVT